MKLKPGYGIQIYDPNSPVIITDGYKPSHPKLYPFGMEFMQSYFESRVGAKWDWTVFFGLQYFLLKYLAGQTITKERIEQAEEFYANYFNNPNVFDRRTWDFIEKEYDGRLPIRIRALDEGTVVPVSCAMMTVENTDKGMPDQILASLVNHLETLLSNIWYPCTVATQSRAIKLDIWNWVKKAGGPKAAVDWMCHDFGARGVSCPEQAAIGGAAHLLSFFGSDTLAGDIMLRNYYGGTGLVSGSIPASEHSTVTTWGQAHEEDFLVNACKQYPTGLLANVIDSYDPHNYICGHAAKHKDLILSRDGKLIFRPDSGDPQEQSVARSEDIFETFGETTNELGFRLFNPKIGGIYGDGMNKESINEFYGNLYNHKIAPWMWAVGSGGGLLQKINRDTQRFAFKANWCQVEEVERDVFKKPSSDHTKDSKRGRLSVVRIEDQLQTIPESWLFKDELQVVFENGEMKRLQSLDEIRERAAI